MKIYRNKKPNTPAVDAAQPAAAEPASPEPGPAAAKTSKAAKGKPQPETPQGEMVTIIKSAQAPKLSPRGDGQLTYQVGRVGEVVRLRIFHNQSAGRFSKEWVPVSAIRDSLGSLPKGQPLFKPAIGLKSAWKGQSACNSGFGAAILKAEGVFVADLEKKGMMRLVTPDALDKWEQAMLAIKVPKGAEQVPLHPPKVVPDFGKRAKSQGNAGAASAGGATGDQTVEKSPREDEAPRPAAEEETAEGIRDTEVSQDANAAPEPGDDA